MSKENQNSSTRFIVVKEEINCKDDHREIREIDIFEMACNIFHHNEEIEENQDHESEIFILNIF